MCVYIYIHTDTHTQAHEAMQLDSNKNGCNKTLPTYRCDRNLPRAIAGPIRTVPLCRVHPALHTQILKRTCLFRIEFINVFRVIRRLGAWEFIFLQILVTTFQIMGCHSPKIHHVNPQSCGLGQQQRARQFILNLRNVTCSQNVRICASRQEVSFLMLKSFVVAGLIPQSLKIETQIALANRGVPEACILSVFQVVCCCVSAQHLIVRK